jgi:hypothetical protein
MGGHHAQFNVVDPETLRTAQRDPDRFRDLIVRVAGYSDFFCDIGAALQDEIISRTTQGGSAERVSVSGPIAIKPDSLAHLTLADCMTCKQVAVRAIPDCGSD